VRVPPTCVFHQHLYRHLCCSVLQCDAVCCSVLQCVAVCFAICCIVLHVLQCVAGCCRVLLGVAVCCSVLQCVAVCCSALQCAAVKCSMFQCAAVLQFVLVCFIVHVPLTHIFPLAFGSMLQCVAIYSSMGVATVSRIDIIIDLFCRILSL